MFGAPHAALWSVSVPADVRVVGVGTWGNGWVVVMVVMGTGTGMVVMG